MAGHRLDAEQIRGLDHVGALGGVSLSRALPEIAAIEQQRAARTDIVAQPVDQGLQMGEAAELAEARGGFFEIQKRECIGIGAVGLDAEAIEEGAADQMRRLALHRADSEIGAGFAKIGRPQLRMGIGHVQDARVAETLQIVNTRAVGAARSQRQRRRQRGGAGKLKKIPAADGHAISPAPRQAQ